MARFDKRLPYVNAFLTYAQNDPAKARQDLAIGGGIVSVLALAPMVGITAGVALSNPGPGIIAGFLTLIAGGWAVNVLRKRQGKPRDEAERAKIQAHHSSKPFQALRGRNRLHREVDASVLHLLEASAYHWSRVQSALNGPIWNAPDIGAHWAGVRQQAQLAADTAMSELMTMASSAIGLPQRDRDVEAKGVMKDFFDLEITEALNNLKTLAASDWTEYAHKSAHSEHIVRGGMAVAERLRHLADEVEGAQSSLSSTPGAAPVEYSSSQTLDAVLSELKAVKQAEDELRVQQGDSSS